LSQPYIKRINKYWFWLLNMETVYAFSLLWLIPDVSDFHEENSNFRNYQVNLSMKLLHEPCLVVPDIHFTNQSLHKFFMSFPRIYAYVLGNFWLSNLTRSSNFIPPKTAQRGVTFIADLFCLKLQHSNSLFRKIKQ
jgi:hypothetical protein